MYFCWNIEMLFLNIWTKIENLKCWWSLLTRSGLGVGWGGQAPGDGMGREYLRGGGSITIPLTSCLIGLESVVWQLTIFVFICKTDLSIPIKQEVNGTLILPILVFPGMGDRKLVGALEEIYKTTFLFCETKQRRWIEDRTPACSRNGQCHFENDKIKKIMN